MVSIGDSVVLLAFDCVSNDVGLGVGGPEIEAAQALALPLGSTAK